MNKRRSFGPFFPLWTPEKRLLYGPEFFRCPQRKKPLWTPEKTKIKIADSRLIVGQADSGLKII